MKKQIPILAVMAGLLAWASQVAALGPCFAAEHVDTDDERPLSGFQEWKQHPKEKFSDGEKMFRKVKELIRSEYYDKDLKDDDIYRAATQGILEKLGGWDKLLTPEEYASLKQEISGDVVGAGIQMEFDEKAGMAHVQGVLAGSPAEKEGVEAGDRILKVDGKTLVGKNLKDVVFAIRGKEGSTVKLELLRGTQVISKKIRREKVVIKSVDSTVLPENIGLIAARTFTDKTADTVRQALEDLKKKGVKGLLLDLRSNAGGALANMRAVAELFIPSGRTIVISESRKGREEMVSKGPGPVLNVPILVIADKTTGSGAEFVAAALKQHLGAKIIGERTFGKWNGQTLEELPNGFAIKFSVSRYYPPNGEDLNGKGLSPDIEVGRRGSDIEKARHSESAGKRIAGDAQLKAAYEMMKLQVR